MWNERLSRICFLQNKLTTIVINNRTNPDFQWHDEDEYQPLREELQKLRKEEFGTKETLAEKISQKKS